jgi:hypothetical protein
VHVTKTKAVRVSLLPGAVRREALAEASRFRGEFYECLTARRDALFELSEAVLCADGAVKSPVDLTLLPEHRRGHGAMYGGLNRGRIDMDRLRTVLAGLSLPRFDGGRLVLAVDVSPWLRPDAPCSAERLFCPQRLGSAPARRRPVRLAVWHRSTRVCVEQDAVAHGSVQLHHHLLLPCLRGAVSRLRILDGG